MLQNVPQGNGLVRAGCLLQLFVNRLLQSLARLKSGRFAQLDTHRTVALALGGLEKNTNSTTDVQPRALPWGLTGCFRAEVLNHRSYFLARSPKP